MKPYFPLLSAVAYLRRAEEQANASFTAKRDRAPTQRRARKPETRSYPEATPQTVRAMHALGFTDSDIARELGITRPKATELRRRCGLWAHDVRKR